MATKSEIRHYAKTNNVSMSEAKEHFIQLAKAKAEMPSFIVRLKVDQNWTVTYDKTDLVESQISFAEKCIDQLKTEAIKNVEDPAKLFGFVFWGNKEDFSASLSAAKQDADLDSHWTETKDMFFSRYWDTTNQKIELSEDYCNSVTGSTQYAPMGAKLGDIAPHEYSNFAISVAYTKQFAKFSKVGGMSIGDLAPPEVDPNSKLYNPNYIAKVKQALSNFGIEIDADWKPGHMVTTLLAI